MRAIPCALPGGQKNDVGIQTDMELQEIKWTRRKAILPGSKPSITQHNGPGTAGQWNRRELKKRTKYIRELNMKTAAPESNGND